MVGVDIYIYISHRCMSCVRKTESGRHGPTEQAAVETEPADGRPVVKLEPAEPVPEPPLEVLEDAECIVTEWVQLWNDADALLTYFSVSVGSRRSWTSWFWSPTRSRLVAVTTGHRRRLLATGQPAENVENIVSGRFGSLQRKRKR